MRTGPSQGGGAGSPKPLENTLKKLADKDSNLDKQNQNLLCYRYTIGQCEAREGCITRGENRAATGRIASKRWAGCCSDSGFRTGVFTLGRSRFPERKDRGFHSWTLAIS